MVARGRYGNLDYPSLTKAGFLLGLAMFLVGVGGEYVGYAYFGGLPGWEETLLYLLAVIGLLVGFVSPFVFGVFLPLTE
ncbi:MULTISPECIES: hypothetical protein [Saliphagus]|uniref:Uncharacterized protein n=1 Tax=Saliphagus infecundisoli TaxID=1849069 RepID=A0ABD5QGD1_9EURY|nr:MULTISPECIES: hypothetical protein [Saliphagus]